MIVPAAAGSTKEDPVPAGDRRDGKSIIYSLADEHVRTIINQGMEHLQED